MDNLKDAAIQYAKKGYPVFPIVPNEKRPITRTGFKEATTDIRKIEKWWRDSPNANIGMPTGAPSGISAIDIDVDPVKEKDGLKEWGNICRDENIEPYTTRANETPRGGRHELHKHIQGVKNTTDKLANGIDTRGEGGYIFRM